MTRLAGPLLKMLTLFGLRAFIVCAIVCALAVVPSELAGADLTGNSYLPSESENGSDLTDSLEAQSIIDSTAMGSGNDSDTEADAEAAKRDDVLTAPLFERLEKVFWPDFLIFVEDNLLYFSGPLRWDQRDWSYMGGMAALQTVQIAWLDDPTRDLVMRNNRNEGVRDVVDLLEIYGDVGIATIGGAAVYSVGFFSGSQDIRELGLVLTESIFASGVLALGVRYVAGRSRPFSGDGPGKFNWFEGDFELQAWPSGHVILAFGVSSAVAGFIDEPWAYATFYGLAGIVGLSRVYTNDHWGSDVTLATLMGISSGVFALNRLEERRNPGAKKSGLELRAGLGSLHMRWRF